MPAERLCLGCGVQSIETFGLLPPQDRGKLFEATLRLMRLMLVDEPMDVTDDEEQLRRALMPLVHNRDGHFLATLPALLLSLLEGKTDCPINGVFGAGKTRAAAAIIPGLITVDPSLKIMILTKENVASQAFAEHIIRLSLPTWIERKCGRLVGFMALQNQTTSSTRLDVPTAHRHDVLRTKQVIIGCGGGFRHECASKYSPVAQWMSEVDLALQDESQQYGNLDETADFFLLAAAWIGPGRSALQSAEQWCKRRYGRIHQVGKMSFCDKNMHKGRLKQHTKGNETGNHPQKVPRLQKRAPVMSERQPLCRRECNSIGRRWLFGETNRKHLCQSQCASHKKVEDIKEKLLLLAFNWVFRVKYCFVKSHVRGKPSSNGFSLAKVVKHWWNVKLHPPQIPLSLSWLGEAKIA